jgi:raffinose/stachyose/melibiose transport system permease protein
LVSSVRWTPRASRWRRALASQYSVDTAKVLAFTSLSMMPALVFFTLFQRRVVGGLTGAVKG